MIWFFIWLAWTVLNYRLIRHVGKAYNLKSGIPIAWSEADRNTAIFAAVLGPIGTIVGIVIGCNVLLEDGENKPSSW